MIPSPTRQTNFSENLKLFLVCQMFVNVMLFTICRHCLSIAIYGAKTNLLFTIFFIIYFFFKHLFKIRRIAMVYSRSLFLKNGESKLKCGKVLDATVSIGPSLCSM